MITDDPHRAAGAYALDALPHDEREAFERHLGDCGPCSRETAELRATAARLGAAVSARPHPQTRERVLRRVAAIRQEVPEGVPVTGSGRAARRARSPAGWARAACLAAAVVLGGTGVWQHQRAEDALARELRSARRAERIAAVLAAPDTRTASAALPGGATVTVVVSRAEDRAVFAATGLARPPAGKAYQLWFDDGGAMRPAGLLDPGHGDRAVLMRGPVAGASGTGITVEPSGGSPRPTSRPLALLRFPAGPVVGTIVGPVVGPVRAPVGRAVAGGAAGRPSRGAGARPAPPRTGVRGPEGPA